MEENVTKKYFKKQKRKREKKWKIIEALKKEWKKAIIFMLGLYLYWSVSHIAPATLISLLDYLH